MKTNFKKVRKKLKLFLKTRFLLWFWGGLILLVFLTTGLYHLAYWHKIFPGISVLGLDLSNQTPTQAQAKLTDHLTKQNFFQIPIRSDGQFWSIQLNSIGFQPNLETTIEKAYRLGRQGQFSQNLLIKWQAWRQGINLKLDYSLSESLLRNQIATISAQVYIPAVEPQIKITAKGIEIEAGQPGQEVDQRALLAQARQRLQNYDSNSIDLPVLQLNPQLSPEQIEQTKKRVESLLGKSIKLLVEEQGFVLGQEEIINFLDFTNGFDQVKIEAYLKNLGQSVNRPPQNAAFQFASGRVVVFKPAKEGLELNQVQSLRDLNAILTQLETSEEKELAFNLQVSKTQPAIKTEDVNSLGIKELLGRGISYFRGSIASRIHNIQLASSRLNGLLVPPGEVFSFNQALGEVSQATGYREAYIIKEGRTILGDGGGVCQVSTTFFRAALYSGLPIIERQAHAYRVSYYEQNTQVGIDATVWEPTADLKIKNDTPAHILIQAQVNTAQKILVFGFYGTGDGRRAIIGKSRIWDQVPPPPDLYQDDPTLPAGTVKQIDWKAWGAKVAFDWRVERAGEVLQERTFYSAYRPWQAVFLRGTGPAQ